MTVFHDMPKFAGKPGQSIGSRYAKLRGVSGLGYFVTEVPAQYVSTFRNCVLIAENRGTVVGVWHNGVDRAFVAGTGHPSDVEAQFGSNVRWFVYFLGHDSSGAVADLVPDRFQYEEDVAPDIKMAA